MTEREEINSALQIEERHEKAEGFSEKVPDLAYDDAQQGTTQPVSHDEMPV